ncbi:MAG TPA: hypothetical protein VMX94_06645 [Armatimonadota bacterium]|nr:hypothetical protein [Armatimonadota bacterium]
MKIAVIAWGSLIWCPGSLQIGSWWHKDGPELPIEFARISDDGRLTLVIYPEYLNPDTKHLVTTYWAMSSLNRLQDAIDNLKIREGNPQCPVHYADRGGNFDCPDPHIRQIIEDWLKAHNKLDAAIWTGLKSNWDRKSTSPIGGAEVVQYLRLLKYICSSACERAEEYIRNTPDQIRTPYRQEIETQLGWTAHVLPTILFV